MFNRWHCSHAPVVGLWYVSEKERATGQVCPLSLPLTMRTSGKIKPSPRVYADAAIDKVLGQWQAISCFPSRGKAKKPLGEANQNKIPNNIRAPTAKGTCGLPFLNAEIQRTPGAWTQQDWDRQKETHKRCLWRMGNSLACTRTAVQMQCLSKLDAGYQAKTQELQGVRTTEKLPSSGAGQGRRAGRPMGNQVPRTSSQETLVSAICSQKMSLRKWRFI